MKTFVDVYQEVLDAVDRVGVGAFYDQGQPRLKAAAAAWDALGGDEKGRGLIQKAQGVVGAVNVNQQDGQGRDEAFRQLLALKRELYAAREDARDG
jgi:hypothetical protein